MVKCFTTTAADEMKAFDGADRFFPINYKGHWAVVRQVSEGRRRSSTAPPTRRKASARKKPAKARRAKAQRDARAAAARSKA